jgi:predicted ABC-type ATPase
MSDAAEDLGKMPAFQRRKRDDSPPGDTARPILLLLVGASGSGRTTFYDSHLKTVFPKLLKVSASLLEQAETDEERKRLLKTGESFVYQDVVFDPQLIREAKSTAFEVKAVYLANEDPTLNLGRVLIRVNNGGRFAPVSRIPGDYAKGLKQLPKIRKLADDLMLFDNTAHARGPRLVAHFQQGRLQKLARAIPRWAQKAFEKEFDKWLHPSAARQ